MTQHCLYEMTPVEPRSMLDTEGCTQNVKVYVPLHLNVGFPDGSDSKESACNAGHLGSVTGSGREPLEKGMATYSSILAQRIPWTEEPGGLQSTGLQRVGHD